MVQVILENVVTCFIGTRCRCCECDIGPITNGWMSSELSHNWWPWRATHDRMTDH